MIKTTLQLAACVAAFSLVQTAAAQDIRFFFAEEGLTNPGDNPNNAASPVDAPQLLNPEAATNGFPKRLYIWAQVPNGGDFSPAASLNVSVTGSAKISDLTIYNPNSIPWAGSGVGGINPGASAPGGTRWEGTNAVVIFAQASFGIAPTLVSIGDFTQGDLQLVGHIECSGVGEVFMEVGERGITVAPLHETLPGPAVALGFGDATVSGSAFSTPSSNADAVLVCVGDLNGDLIVDTADLGSLISEFGTAGVVADINNDGVVDTADLGALIAQFGSVCTDMLEK